MHFCHLCSYNQFFPCHQCGKRYIRNTHLRRHLRFECYKDPQFVCIFCGKKFHQRCNLKVHIIRRHPSVPKLITFFARDFDEYSDLNVYNRDRIRYGWARRHKIYRQKKTLGRHLRSHA
ncbi:oocyte zinc finger protein XlCOF19-like [Cylas formicarius]|uniref:oocyte zinc finger protein XlCOF19-like n=1 Tax=Cylas formicarius TaxID=197179 RepID=UPI002958AC31|nr:oocyte zinc finger protein XlCOF19-like [Cylas formicarius]